MRPHFIKVAGRNIASGDIVFNLNAIEEVRRHINAHGNVEYVLYGSQNTSTTVSSYYYDCSALEQLFSNSERSPASQQVTEDRRVEL